MNEAGEKPRDIVKFTTEKLSVDEASQLVASPCCGAISLFVGESWVASPRPQAAQLLKPQECLDTGVPTGFSEMSRKPRGPVVVGRTFFTLVLGIFRLTR